MAYNYFRSFKPSYNYLKTNSGYRGAQLVRQAPLPQAQTVLQSGTAPLTAQQAAMPGLSKIGAANPYIQAGLTAVQMGARTYGFLKEKEALGKEIGTTRRLIGAGDPQIEAQRTAGLRQIAAGQQSAGRLTSALAPGQRTYEQLKINRAAMPAIGDVNRTANVGQAQYRTGLEANLAGLQVRKTRLGGEFARGLTDDLVSGVTGISMGLADRERQQGEQAAQRAEEQYRNKRILMAGDELELSRQRLNQPSVFGTESMGYHEYAPETGGVRQLLPGLQQSEKPQLINTVDKQGNPIQVFALPQVGAQYPSYQEPESPSGFSLSPGQARYDASGKLIVSRPEAAKTGRSVKDTGGMWSPEADRAMRFLTQNGERTPEDGVLNARRSGAPGMVNAAIDAYEVATGIDLRLLEKSIVGAIQSQDSQWLNDSLDQLGGDQWEKLLDSRVRDTLVQYRASLRQPKTPNEVAVAAKLDLTLSGWTPIGIK